MKPKQYREFTQKLLDSLGQRPEIIGLVALGSMAAQDYAPDEWSDHDFFVLAESGYQEALRNDLRWLPGHEQIVFSFRETPHGIKVVYGDAHLLEFAVFDLEELKMARINRYRILLDRCNLESHMKKVREVTLNQRSQPDADWLLGQFLTNLLVGVGRYRRGEELSGHFFVKSNALRHLVQLGHACLTSPQRKLLDDLDPFRRLEFVFPDAARTLNEILLLKTPEAAAGLLEFANEYFRDRLPGYPSAAFQTVKDFIERP